MELCKLRSPFLELRNLFLDFVATEIQGTADEITEYVFLLEKAVSALRTVAPDKRYKCIYECTDENIIESYLIKNRKENVIIQVDQLGFGGKLYRSFELYHAFLFEYKEQQKLEEGGVFEHHAIGYERSAKARAKCLQHYGYRCYVCNIDFVEMYGECGKDFIEVHHIDPLSTIKENHSVDPIEHLRPLCSNCHSMIHREIKLQKRNITPNEFRQHLTEYRITTGGVELWQRKH